MWFDLVAAVEEERFRRVKHWAGFPRESIRTCLEIAGVTPNEVDHFTISRDPKANLLRKAFFTLWNRPNTGLV
jgi:carbamoyltransferase